MAYAVPGEPALASEYNKVVDNVDELGRGTLFSRYDASGQLGPTNGIPSGSWTKLKFDTSSQSSSYVAVNAAMNEFTINKTGTYDLSAGYRIAGTGGGVRHVRISSASDYNYNYAGNTFSSGDPNVSGSCSRPVYLTAGVVLSVWAYQATGSMLDTTPVGQSNFIAIRYCGES